MDPISPLLNINQKQKQPPAPAPTLTVRDAPRQKSPYEMRPKRCRACLQSPVRKEGTQGPREKCCLGRGNPPGATCCCQALAFYIMDGNYLCSASPVPRVPAGQCSLMALLLSEIKPPSGFSPCHIVQIHTSTKASKLLCLGLRVAMGGFCKMWVVAQISWSVQVGVLQWHLLTATSHQILDTVTVPGLTPAKARDGSGTAHRKHFATVDTG